MGDCEAHQSPKPNFRPSLTMTLIILIFSMVRKIGAIDNKTMRNFDTQCLEVLCKREHVLQPIFALYLNVSKNLVSDWERGIKKPGLDALT